MFDETLYLNSRIYIIIALIGMIFLQFFLLIDQETANFSNPGFDLASWKAQSALWWFLSCSTKIFGASLKLNTPIFFKRPY